MTWRHHESGVGCSRWSEQLLVSDLASPAPRFPPLDHRPDRNHVTSRLTWVCTSWRLLQTNLLSLWDGGKKPTHVVVSGLLICIEWHSPGLSRWHMYLNSGMALNPAELEIRAKQFILSQWVAKGPWTTLSGPASGVPCACFGGSVSIELFIRFSKTPSKDQRINVSFTACFRLVFAPSELCLLICHHS